MATTKLNAIILAAARLLKTPRTDPTADVNPYTSALLTEYANRAIRDLLLDNFIKLGIDAFSEAFPEYMKTTGAALVLTSGKTSKPTDAFQVVNLYNTVNFLRLEQKDVVEVKLGVHPIIIPSAVMPVFYQEGEDIYTLGLTTGSVYARYIEVPADATPVTGTGGTDIKLNNYWHSEVISRIVNMGLADAKKAVMSE